MNEFEKRMDDLEATIKVLEENKTREMEKALLKNTDEYAVKFVKTLKEDDIYYKQTDELFEEYLTYRREFTTRSEELLSMRMFNNVVRNFFPTSSIQHANKKGKNIYYWAVK